MKNNQSKESYDEDQSDSGKTICSAPNNIWLQYHGSEEDSCDCEELGAPGEVTWAKEKINKADINYFRADALLDPQIVFMNMMRGTMAKPTAEQVKSLFPHLFESKD